MGLIDNKTAVITGGWTETGFEIAKRFYGEGARIVLFGPDGKEIAKVCKTIDPEGRRVSGVVGDAGKKEDVKMLVDKALEETGRIDILVVHTDLVRYGELDKTDPDLWMKLMDTNAYAPWRLMVSVLPAMRRLGGGAIVNISSVAGNTPFAGAGVYCASHAAMQMISQVMAKEVSSDNIRVNLICPRMVEGEEADNSGAGDAPMSDITGKIGDPEGVADAALFLVSDQSEWLTGITLDLDGGSHLSAVLSGK